jgi:hypothetical protein
MAPKKLTAADKKSILTLYREPEETTSTLADRFGVSNSTISRLLKASLPEKEYGRLIQQKRSTADKSGNASAATKPEKTDKPSAPKTKAKEKATPASEPTQSEKPAPVLKPKDPAPQPEPEPTPEPTTSEKPTPVKRTRRRSRTDSEETAAQLELPTQDEPLESEQSPTEAPAADEADLAADMEQDVAEDISADWDDDVSSLGDDYEDDEDDEDYDEEGETWDGEEEGAAPHLEKLEITPLTDASLPSLCYVVVERSSSELVALPLRTFAHLGEIPEAEGESRTLPVFDNHRVARRFSRRNQRVVKLPDGGLLQTTSPYLMAKGITRLLIDGQVFALEEDNGYEDDTDFE